MKVLIYAPVDVFYYSYYIEGFYRLYGKKNIKFSTLEFPAFPERILAIIIKHGTSEKRIIIDALDTSTIFENPLEWSDVYGKVNYNENKIPSGFQNQIFALGPGFGIKLWSFPKTLQLALTNYIKSRNRIYFKKYFFTSYWRQYKRLPLSDYKKSIPQKSFIFFLSSLWKNESKTNERRANFIIACKELDQVNFEGGFAPRSDNMDLGYKELIYKRIILNKYLDKIKKSILVFNTPAVQDCHGWKLPEFLMLGKAIISTAHVNNLAIPLEHGVHLHYVGDSKEEIKEGILKILENPEYRTSLEQNSLEYFSKNLAPQIVVKRLIDHPGI